MGTWEHLWERASVGPIPGRVMVLCGILFYGALIVVGLTTLQLDRTKHKDRPAPVTMG
jgi:uncharacterized membrane protein